MDGAQFDAWTRRRVGFAVGGALLAALGLLPRDEAAARKHQRRKRREPPCKRTSDKCQKSRECCGQLYCLPVLSLSAKRCCLLRYAFCTRDQDCCGSMICLPGRVRYCEIP